MGVVVVVVVIDVRGRFIRVFVVGRGGIGVVEGIRRREAEESPEAESEATQLLQWEAADEIQQLLAGQPLWHARYELPCVGGHVRHREHHQAVEHHLFGVLNCPAFILQLFASFLFLSTKISHHHVFSLQFLPSKIPTQQEKSQEIWAPKTLFANGEAAENTVLHPPTLRVYALVLARPRYLRLLAQNCCRSCAAAI